jgi:hypothetical protein
MAIYANTEVQSVLDAGGLQINDFMILPSGQVMSWDGDRWNPSIVGTTGEHYYVEPGQTTTSGLRWDGSSGFVSENEWNDVSLSMGDIDPGTTSIVATNTGNKGVSNMAPGDAAWTDWSPVFGEYTPQQQYTSLMSSAMPQYFTPRWGQMAQRQFAPTFGRYLLGGYGGDTVGLGTGADFANWYQGQGASPGIAPTANPQNIGAGYNRALEFGALNPGSAGWTDLAAQNAGMAYAMQDPEAVQAMALARYYGGGGPAGGYAGRAVQQTLGNLYDRYMTAGAQTGVTGPSGFLNYLGTLGGNRFGAVV